jgi:hypothetical protein
MAYEGEERTQKQHSESFPSSDPFQTSSFGFIAVLNQSKHLIILQP